MNKNICWKSYWQNKFALKNCIIDYYKALIPFAYNKKLWVNLFLFFKHIKNTFRFLFLNNCLDRNAEIANLILWVQDWGLLNKIAGLWPNSEHGNLWDAEMWQYDNIPIVIVLCLSGEKMLPTD